MSVLDMTSVEFMREVNDRVTKILGADLTHAFDTAGRASATTRRFVDILGTTDKAHWWRLYINPKDWTEALIKSETNSDPRLLYDNDDVEANQPKGFHKPMTAAYQKYLVEGSFDDRIGPTATSTIKFEQYSELWTATKPEGEQNTFRFRVADPVSFGTPRQYAPDMFTEKLTIHNGSALVEYRLLAVSKDQKAFAVNSMNRTWTATVGDNLKQGIDFVFQRFHDEMRQANLRKEQLRAIARAIRALHIMHPFTNGCGRCNVFTLLPLMLLRYGFGLPLGGEFGGSLDRRAMDMMFNGGYSVEEITRFLWVYQDFGLINRARKQPTGIAAM